MRRHSLDLLADLSNDTRGSRIRWIKYADRVHQFLDCDGRVVHLALRDQIIQHLRRSILQLINVYEVVKQASLSTDQDRLIERKFGVTSPRQRILRIKPHPAPL